MVMLSVIMPIMSRTFLSTTILAYTAVLPILNMWCMAMHGPESNYPWAST